MTSDDNNTQELQRQIYALEKRLKQGNKNARIDECLLFLKRFEENNDPWRNQRDIVNERLAELKEKE